MVKVGIIANPISARDIRRVISHAGNLPINDRANIVLRMMAGLAAAGVQEVVVMPENGGIRFHLERSIRREARLGHANFPQLRYLDMPVTATSEDSARAARMMAEDGVGAIVVLGGDGTNRVVVGACGKVPVAGVSTGTNNAFPELREPTITSVSPSSTTSVRPVGVPCIASASRRAAGHVSCTSAFGGSRKPSAAVAWASRRNRFATSSWGAPPRRRRIRRTARAR